MARRIQIPKRRIVKPSRKAPRILPKVNVVKPKPTGIKPTPPQPSAISKQGISLPKVKQVAATAKLSSVTTKASAHRDINSAAPKDLLIYYGWLNSFNNAANGWDNEKVAQDMKKYDLIVFGNGIQDSGHGDYANTSVIIPRIKELNSDVLMFGYVDATVAATTCAFTVDDWKTLECNGIFYDQFGYDFGVDREKQNILIDDVHSEDMVCFVNSWNIDHSIGTENDVSYPNVTWNSGLVESNLNSNDWYLLESFPVNTTSYASSPHMEAHDQWVSRGRKAALRRQVYGPKMAAISVIANANGDAQDLFNSSYYSALVHALNAHGSSDTGYAAGTAAVTFWNRPYSSFIGWYDLEPFIRVTDGDADNYYRTVPRHRKIRFDFGQGVSAGSIE